MTIFAETILLVEDGDTVRRAVTRMLSTQGYTILQAAGGRQAIALAEEYCGPIDLLLTDLEMPEMNGREVAKAVKQRRPDIRVLVMSGYPKEVIHRKGIKSDGIPYVEKWSFSHDLLRKVRSVLDATPTAQI